jgi:hypothetical protein
MIDKAVNEVSCFHEGFMVSDWSMARYKTLYGQLSHWIGGGWPFQGVAITEIRDTAILSYVTRENDLVFR